MSVQSDSELLKALKSDVRTVYADVYKEHINMIRHLVLKNSGSQEDAEDVFQDAMIALFELVRKPDFELKASFKTIIYSISRNIWFKRLRDKKGDTLKAKDYEEYYEMDWNEEEVQKDKHLTILERTLKSMGPPCETILVEFYFFKTSMANIAEQVGYSDANHAKAQKYKCIKRLKNLVSGA